MPVTNAKTQDLIDNTLTDMYQTAIGIIDTRLTDREYLVQNKYGGVNDPHWIINVNGTGSKKDKEQLTKDYTDAGWFRVSVTNSEDVDQKPGLMTIRLHKLKAPENNILYGDK